MDASLYCEPWTGLCFKTTRSPWHKIPISTFLRYPTAGLERQLHDRVHNMVSGSPDTAEMPFCKHIAAIGGLCYK